MSRDVTFAKAGGPPEDWMHVRVRDLATGEEVTEVFEVDTAAGYVLVPARAENGTILVDYFDDEDQLIEVPRTPEQPNGDISNIHAHTGRVRPKRIEGRFEIFRVQ